MAIYIHITICDYILPVLGTIKLLCVGSTKKTLSRYCSTTAFTLTTSYLPILSPLGIKQGCSDGARRRAPHSLIERQTQAGPVLAE